MEADPVQSATVLARAHLTEEQWLDLIPALPIAARGHVRQRHDLGPRVAELVARLGIPERALPPADMACLELVKVETLPPVEPTAPIVGRQGIGPLSLLLWLMAGRNRLTIASSVASLSARLRHCWCVASRIKRCDSMAMGDVAAIRWPHLT